jgi:AcrR family transcriptional regulator
MAESSAKPRRYAPRMPPNERREQLLDATLALIAEFGYGAVSMEGIARRGGVAKPVVYDAFGSLPNLIDALIEREEEKVLLQLDELLPTPAEDADPAELLVQEFDALLRAVEGHPDGWRLSLAPADALPRVVRERVERRRGRVHRRVESMVRSGVERLAVPISDLEMLVETIVLLAIEAARRHLDEPRRYSRKRLTGFGASMLESVRG